MCQVHTGADNSLLAPEKADYTVCHPGKTTTCIIHVVPITTHTHVRRESIGKKKQRKKEKIKERKGKERRRKMKGKKRKETTRRKQGKEREGKKAKKERKEKTR